LIARSIDSGSPGATTISTQCRPHRDAGGLLRAVKSGQVPIRLLAEITAVVALVEVGLMLWLPRLLPSPLGTRAALLNAALLVLITAPLLYWRCMRATRRAGALALAGHNEAPVSEMALPATSLAGSAARRRRAAVVMTASAQALGLLLTAAAMRLADARIDDEAHGRFERHVERLQTEIQRRFQQPVYGLMGARGAYAASGRIDRNSLAAYTVSRNLPREFPGVLGFGFIERVERTDLGAFIDRARSELGPDFTVHGDGDASDLYVIRYIEPLSENLPAWGRDLGAERIRREAIERAIDTGEPSLTGRVRLMRASNQDQGFLFLLPIYRHGTDASGSPQRRRTLLGLLYAPIDAGELMASVLAAADHALDFELFDGDALQPEQLVFESAGRTSAGMAREAADAAGSALFGATRSLQIGGRLLTLRVGTSPGFESGIDRDAIAYIGLAGALLSCLFALTVWSLAAGRVRALSLAQRMTADLDRLAQVVRHTQNAVIITDRELRISWINEGFTRITGYTLDEARGRTPGELLGSGEADPAVLKRLADSAAAGRSCRVEILNRRKNGRTYWIDTEIQPLHDTHGQLTGFMEIGSDTTDKREASDRLQAALRENASLLGVIQQHAIVGSADPQGRLTDVNDAYCRVSGYRREELIGRNHLLVDTGLDTDEFRQVIAPLLQAGQAWRGELCNLAKDGTPYWVDAAIAPFFDAGGRIERFITIRHDITARETAARELARERERLDNIVRGTHGGTWEWNVQTGETVINDRWAEIIGYTLAELAPLTIDTWRRSAHPDDLRRSEELLARHFAGRLDYYDCELRARHKAGHWVWIHARGRLAERSADGRPLWMAGTHMDISARKRAEAAVAESEHLMRLVTDNIPGRLAYFDNESRLKFANRASFSFFGGSAQTRIGQTFGQMLGPERASAFGERAMLALQGVPQTYDSKSAGIDGAVSHAIVHLVPDERDGEVHGFIAMATDVTALKQATAAAEAASQAKSRFLANMSHEIRTPMNAILGMLKLLHNTGLSPRQQDYAGKTERAARALLALLNDILDFSKVEAGKLELDQRPFAVDTLLRDLSVILSANLGARAVEVLFDIDPKLPPRLVADDLRLQQVLINLAGNAIKFTESGEVVVGLKLVAGNATDALVEFSVRDTGIGISPEHQEHIFDGFSQAEASTTRRFGGTGLGLSICQRLVALMGGTITLDSAPGRGSRFAFTLALQVADDDDDASRPVPTPAPLRALIVDDNPTARTVLATMAQSLGWQVDVAAGGTEALACVERRQQDGGAYDAVFVDWQMPDRDGWQTSRDIREMTGGTAPLLLMVTAHARERLIERPAAEQALLDGFVVKPATAPMLADALREARHRASGHANMAAPPAPAPGARLAGLRLLVVEDNPTNQQVAQELLEDEGAQVTLAADGRQGIAAVEAADPPFDAVLMDVQMPVMDGYAAASHIRNVLGLGTLPIVAMTANAMPGDRAASLAAGMAAHVGKPFDLDQLVETLRRHVRQPAVADEPSALPPASPAPPPAGRRAPPLPAVLTPDVIGQAKAAGFDLVAALQRLAGRADVYVRLARSFDERLADLPDELDGLLRHASRDEAERLAHTIKGLAATLGALSLAERAGEVEQALRQWPPQPAAAEWQPHFDTAVHDARRALETLLPHLATGPGQARTPAPSAAVGAAPPTTRGPSAGNDDNALRQAIEGLIALLRESDPAATDAFADLALRHGARWQQALAPLATAMAALDFAAAAQVCAALVARLEPTAAAPAPPAADAQVA
jgi:PAS domain S-box-containing protein